MCFGKTPKIEMPAPPPMPMLPPLPQLQAPPPPPKPLAVPDPVNLRGGNDFGTGTSKSGFKPRKKKSARGTNSLRVPLNTGVGGLNI